MGKGQDLLDAARKGDEKSVEKILGQISKRSGPFPSLRRNAAGVNVQDDSGYTPLHHACLQGHREIVRHLLSVDANPCITNDKGATPLHLAAFKGDSEIVAMLLAHNTPPVNVNHVTLANETALIMAAEFGSVHVVSQLLAKGADVTIRNVKDESALDLAAQYGRLKTVKRLIKIHPTLVHPYKFPNWRVRNFSNTPLHRASMNGHEEVVKLLLAAGIDPNIRTNSGTPLHEAACFGKASVVQILLDAGADLNAVDGRDKTVEDLLADYSEEATRRVRRIIRDYKNRKRNNYESEEDVPPFPTHDSSPTSYIPLPGMSSSVKVPEFLSAIAKNYALTKTNNYNTVTNAYSNATENCDDIDRNPFIYKRSNTFSCSQKPDSKNGWINNILLKKNQLFNQRSDGNMQPEIYENAAILNNQSNPSLSLNDIDNVNAKKKPKPLPKPTSREPSQKHIYTNDIISDNNIDPIYNEQFIYENVPDEIKVQMSLGENANNKYVSMDPVPNLPTCIFSANYVKFDGKRRSSDAYMSIDKGETSSASNYHNRGDPGCVFEQNGEYYKHYDLNFTNVLNHEYPFDRTIKKFERLPCYCHEDIKRKRKNIYKSTDNLYSYGSLNETNSNIERNEKEKVKKLSLDSNLIEDMTFEPFNKKSQSNKSRKSKSIVKKKINQLTLLLADWST